jgi:peptidoglycan/LPS O-acetylase OafA/YrhL
MIKPKLVGLELCRGLSMYAVILIHSGDETWGLPINTSAIEFRLLFYFAVPFFLAVAFYLMTAKPENARSLGFWRSRVDRILIPYLCWSLFFWLSRLLVYTLGHQPEKLRQLLQDPLAVVFLGGSSYHLYFLPLLLTGTMLILLMPLLEWLNLGCYRLLVLLGLSFLASDWLENSGNAFQVETSLAFQSLASQWQISLEQSPLVRLALVEMSWLIRCLPYFLVALALNRLIHKNQFQFLFRLRATLVWLTIFLIVDLFGASVFSIAFRELILAYALLLFGISSSSYFKNSWLAKLVEQIGALSFGLYLIHPLLMNIVKVGLARLFPDFGSPISIASMLTLSSLCFISSWIVVITLRQSQPTRRYLLGG